MNLKQIAIMTSVVLCIFHAAVSGQTVMVDAGSASGSSGETIQVPIYLQAVAIEQPVAAQMDINFNTGHLTYGRVVKGPALQGTAIAVVANMLSAGNLRLIVISDDLGQIPNGIIAYLEFQIAAGVPVTATVLNGSNAKSSSANGRSLATAAGNGMVILNGGIGSPKELYFAQIADGGGYITSFVLINPGETAANVLLELFKRDASPLAFILRGNLDNAFSLTLPPHGMAVLESTNMGYVQDGWARARSSTTIGGSIIYAFNPSGLSSISEAGIDPSIPDTNFSFSVDTRRGFLAGLAVANPNNATVTAQFTLYNSSGQQQGQPRSETIPGRNQKVWLVEQLFPSMPASFTGVITVNSTGGSVTGTTLRLNGAVSSFASIPVIVPGAGSSASTLYFPQVADGGGFSTSFALVNPGAAPVTVALQLFKQDGSPLAFNLSGTSGSTFNVTLPAHGLVLLESSNAGGITQSGWARAQATGPIGGSVVYAFTTTPNEERDIAGINPTVPTSAFNISVDTRNTFRSGLAIANPNAGAIQVRMTLYDSTGLHRGERMESLAGMNQKAWQIEQLFSVADQNFTGQINITATGGQIIGTTLRYTPDLSVFASIPVIW